MPQMITGGFRSAEAMNAALASGELDAIGQARPLVAKPELTGALIDGRADRADGFIARLDPLHAMSWKYMQLLGLGADVDFTLASSEASVLYLANEDCTAAALKGRWED